MHNKFLRKIWYNMKKTNLSEMITFSNSRTSSFLQIYQVTIKKHQRILEIRKQFDFRSI
jgi:hypothetical protein